MNPTLFFVPAAKRLGPWMALGVLMVAIAGCTATRFSIRFDRVDGLKKDDPVIFKETAVGKVGKITYTEEGHFLVAVAIPDNFSHAATEHSRFFIGSAEPDSSRKAVIIEQDTPGGAKIAANAVVRGNKKEESPRESAQAAFQSLFKLFGEGMSDLLSDVEKIPETEEYQALKKRLIELEKQLKASGLEIGNTLKNDILPGLEEKLRELAEQLRQQGREDKAQSLENDINRLQEY